MPIEVKELVVKATVIDAAQGPKNGTVLSRTEIERMKQEIMDACLEKLKDELQKIKER